jgi:hypothetical protein
MRLRPRPAAALIAAALIGAPPALAQTGQNRSGEAVAADIAKTPLRDTNIDARDIPVALEVAAENPYAPLGTRSCRELLVGLAELDGVLGPDFDAGAPERDGTGRMAEGVARGVVASLIPFRGVIRQVSGAADAERRYNAAVDAGIARRGYLRGVAAQRGCRLPRPPAESAARK